MVFSAQAQGSLGIEIFRGLGFGVYGLSRQSIKLLNPQILSFAFESGLRQGVAWWTVRSTADAPFQLNYPRPYSKTCSAELSYRPEPFFRSGGFLSPVSPKLVQRNLAAHLRAPSSLSSLHPEPYTRSFPSLPPSYPKPCTKPKSCRHLPALLSRWPGASVSSKALEVSVFYGEGYTSLNEPVTLSTVRPGPEHRTTQFVSV